MITVLINGQARALPEGLTLASLLDWLKLPRDRVAVERNLEIVPRAQWSETPVQAGDRLEVVHFVGGGSGDVRFEFIDLRFHNPQSELGSPRPT